MTPDQETTQPAAVADLLHHLHALDDLAERAQSKAADLAHLLSRGELTRGALVVDAARLRRPPEGSMIPQHFGGTVRSTQPLNMLLGTLLVVGLACAAPIVDFEPATIELEPSCDYGDDIIGTLTRNVEIANVGEGVLVRVRSPEQHFISGDLVAESDLPWTNLLPGESVSDTLSFTVPCESESGYADYEVEHCYPREGQSLSASVGEEGTVSLDALDCDEKWADGPRVRLDPDIDYGSTSSGDGGGGCCRTCTTGQPCGDSCIERGDTCNVSGGCAC